MKTMSHAVVHMGWSPEAFWKATPREFWPVHFLNIEKLEAQSKK
jgi:hypothetical protein